MTSETHASAGQRPLLLLITLTTLAVVTVVRLGLAPARRDGEATPVALATAIATCATVTSAVRCAPPFRAWRTAPKRRAAARPYSVTLGRFQT